MTTNSPSGTFAARTENGRIILVIEDDIDIQDVVEGFFRPRGYKVVRSTDAVSSIQELQSGALKVDVILTDLNLPHMSGIEFTTRMKALGLTTPIILMTAQKGSEIAVEAIEAGAYDFIVKPIHFPQLLVSVERAIHFSRIHRENQVLKVAAKQRSSLAGDGIIGRSPGFMKALDLAKRVSDSAASILIYGESGTGKEVIAKSIHTLGKRSKEPFVAINCSAIPENLLESELFGYAKGAFTGAIDKKIGLFEEAEGGTLFLDEIGDLPLPLQAKLLRVLQERQIKRIGENQMRPINVRVVSATHKDLALEVSAGRFREDLFFRLNVIPITIPPLRERREDIVPLAEFFLAKFAALNGAVADGFTKPALEKMLSYQWRGNVRELENKVERAVVLSTDRLIGVTDLFDGDLLLSTPVASPSGAGALAVGHPALGSIENGMPLGPEGRLLKLEELTMSYIQFALEKNKGAKDRTAQALGIDRKTLYKKLRELDPSKSTVN
jgi:two-component system response regulator HydG